MSLFIDTKEYTSLHFAGILGSGMSAVAQFARWKGIDVSGSDRLIDRGGGGVVRSGLEEMGCRLVAQDGGGIGPNTQAVVVSTAVEKDNRDILAARERGIPVLHRSDVVAALVKTHRGVAVAGTSGKSSVAAVIFELLRACGKNPSLITGAPLVALAEEGYIGNAWAGRSDLLIVEADESDGSLVRYTPDIAVFLNVSKDHQPVDETLGMFGRLASRSRMVFVNADEPLLESIPADRTFGFTEEASFRAEALRSDGEGVTFRCLGTDFTLRQPGAHNASNLLAALSVCSYLDCKPSELVRAAGGLRGIRRRFTVVSNRGGIRVVDDYAHNPAKIAAALRAAHLSARRVLALFQPHGFGPTRFLKKDLAAVFSTELSAPDVLYLLPIYDAGGTAQRDISSGDIADSMGHATCVVHVLGDRREALQAVATEAADGDCIICMGARDPTLEAFAREIANAVGGEPGAQ